jgi:transcriptional regulator with XRE-family HTH domain
MRTLNQVIASLPANRRAKIRARGRELIAEEIALRHLRPARRLTQQRMAKTLGIGQDRISKIENNSDMLLSTLRTYVEAMGGSLRLIAEFPDGVAVLSSLGDTDEMRAPTPSRSRKGAKSGNRRHLAPAKD